MRICLLAFALLSGTGVPALAADVVDDTVIIDDVFNWSGVYVGVQGGYGWGETTLSSPEGLGPDTSWDADGAFAGAHAAVRWQFDRITLGAEAEINYSDVGGSFTVFMGPAFAKQETDINWFGSVNAEIGLPMDRVLFYATAGAAFADIDYRFTGMLPGPVAHTDEDSAVGWTVGAGVDYAVTDNIVVGARYRYYDFGDSDIGIRRWATSF